MPRVKDVSTGRVVVVSQVFADRFPHAWEPVEAQSEAAVKTVPAKTTRTPRKRSTTNEKEGSDV